MTNTVDELKRVRRLFFALTLPDAMQQEIVQWRAGHFSPEAGRPVAAANLHLTLAFLGEVSATKIPGVTAASRAYPTSRFQRDIR